MHSERNTDLSEIAELSDIVRRRKRLGFMAEGQSRRNPSRKYRPGLHCFVTKTLIIERTFPEKSPVWS
jgi:hypothetical protein